MAWYIIQVTIMAWSYRWAKTWWSSVLGSWHKI